MRLSLAEQLVVLLSFPSCVSHVLYADVWKEPFAMFM